LIGELFQAGDVQLPILYVMMDLWHFLEGDLDVIAAHLQLIGSEVIPL
jgi:hypothetical protein